MLLGTIAAVVVVARPAASPLVQRDPTTFPNPIALKGEFTGTWKFLGDAFSTPPTDTDQFTGSTNASLWAPDVTWIRGKAKTNSGSYYMYYSASSAGSQHSAILLAKSTTGLPGSWSDMGIVVSTDNTYNWNAIDPHLVIQGGGWYLTAGSYWSGIQLLAINPATGKLNSSVVTNIAKRTVNNGAVEGSFIYECCNGSPTPSYNMRTARSSSLKGPYVGQGGVASIDGGGSVVLVSHDAIHGPGGGGILYDSDGIYAYYHYLTNGTTVPVLGINKMSFASGWPVLVA
ncbi:hypothetical protein RQP46_008832 [Phenoliferia psychrophenolica]